MDSIDYAIRTTLTRTVEEPRLIYSQQKRLLFIHVSRTGGTTLTDCLRRSLGDSRSLLGQHDFLVAARPVLGAAFDETFKFAFVRNPWDRFVSWYALLGRAGKADPGPVHDPESPHWQGFDAFLESWSSKEVVIDGVVRRALSQWDQLSDTDGTLLTDDLGRFETFAQDATRLLARLEIPCPELPQLNPAAHHHYQAYYTPFGRELVAQVFHNDIQQFGYQFD